MKESEKLEFRDYSKIKGSDRIQINNLLVAICVPTLTIVIALGDQLLNEASIIQLALAIPCLVSSSLAYAKTCYRYEREFIVWDRLGWILHSLGYIMILNSTALTLYFNNHIFSAWSLILTTAVLFIVYSVIDIILKAQRINEKVLKLAFYYLIMGLGFLMPILI